MFTPVTCPPLQALAWQSDQRFSLNLYYLLSGWTSFLFTQSSVEQIGLTHMLNINSTSHDLTSR